MVATATGPGAGDRCGSDGVRPGVVATVACAVRRPRRRKRPGQGEHRHPHGAAGRPGCLGHFLAEQSSFRITARTFEVTEGSHLTDRYTKAIEQLRTTTLDVRLGGISSCTCGCTPLDRGLHLRGAARGVVADTCTSAGRGR